MGSPLATDTEVVAIRKTFLEICCRSVDQSTPARPMFTFGGVLCPSQVRYEATDQRVVKSISSTIDRMSGVVRRVMVSAGLD